MLMCLVAYVRVFICPVRALTFESVDLETSLVVWRHILRLSRSGPYIKVMGQGQGHESKKVTSIMKYKHWRVV